MGIKGGLEASVHLTRQLIETHQLEEDMCLLKLDFSNAFNECYRSIFLQQVESHFSELFGWVQWSYGSANQLFFGPHSILSSSGVQQGDPLGPLLFSLVLCSLLDNHPPSMSSIFQSWYLDDGSIVGPRSEVSNFYNFYFIQWSPDMVYFLIQANVNHFGLLATKVFQNLKATSGGSLKVYLF